MIFAFIFGLGIDYTVVMFYMSKKALLEGQSYIYHGAASVTIAASITLTGLGTLILAKHPILSSVGKTGIIGILSSYIFTITFVPLLVKLTWKNIIIKYCYKTCFNLRLSDILRVKEEE